MTRYIANRLLQLPFLLLVVSALVFVVLRLGPGSPVDLATEAARDPREIERIRHEWGLDRPIAVQYVDYIGGVLRGDFGRSFFGNSPVSSVIAERFPATLELAVAGLILGGLIGIGLGVLAAVKENSPLDTVSRALALTGISLPTFWLGLMLIFFFSFTLGWFPATGQGGVERLILPAFALGLRAAATIARLTRSAMLEVLDRDYIRTAHAKGLAERTVLAGHGLKNAAIPIVTIVGLQFGHLLSGTVVIEQIFGLPGMGWTFVNGIYQRDYPTVQGAVLMLALTFVVVNLLVDLAYAYLDPRIRYG